MERDGLGVNRHNESQCSSQYEDRSPAESHLKYPDREMAAQSKNKRPSYIGRMGSRQRQGTSMSPQSSRSYLNSGSPKMDDKKLQKEDNNSTDRKSSRSESGRQRRRPDAQVYVPRQRRLLNEGSSQPQPSAETTRQHSPAARHDDVPEASNTLSVMSSHDDSEKCVAEKKSFKRESSQVANTLKEDHVINDNSKHRTSQNTRRELKSQTPASERRKKHRSGEQRDPQRADGLGPASLPTSQLTNNREAGASTPETHRRKKHKSGDSTSKSINPASHSKHSKKEKRTRSAHRVKNVNLNECESSGQGQSSQVNEPCHNTGALSSNNSAAEKSEIVLAGDIDQHIINAKSHYNNVSIISEDSPSKPNQNIQNEDKVMSTVADTLQYYDMTDIVQSQQDSLTNSSIAASFHEINNQGMQMSHNDGADEEELATQTLNEKYSSESSDSKSVEQMSSSFHLCAQGEESIQNQDVSEQYEKAICVGICSSSENQKRCSATSLNTCTSVENGEELSDRDHAEGGSHYLSVIGCDGSNKGNHCHDNGYHAEAVSAGFIVKEYEAEKSHEIGLPYDDALIGKQSAHLPVNQDCKLNSKSVDELEESLKDVKKLHKAVVEQENRPSSEMFNKSEAHSLLDSSDQNKENELSKCKVETMETTSDNTTSNSHSSTDGIVNQTSVAESDNLQENFVDYHNVNTSSVLQTSHPEIVNIDTSVTSTADNLAFDEKQFENSAVALEIEPIKNSDDNLMPKPKPDTNSIHDSFQRGVEFNEFCEPTENCHMKIESKSEDKTGSIYETDIVAMETETKEEEDEDSWDRLFDDDGEALDAKLMDQLTAAVGKVSVQKPQYDYYNYQPKDPEMDYHTYGHVIEIYDFSPDLITRDLFVAFKLFSERGFDVKWVDDTHALGVFSSAIAAQQALEMKHPLLKVRELSEASKQSKGKARRCIEFLQPYKERPEMTAAVARNLVTNALGLRKNISKEQRDLEKKQLKEAREKKKMQSKQKRAAWDGSVRGCAMDDPDA